MDYIPLVCTWIVVCAGAVCIFFAVYTFLAFCLKLLRHFDEFKKAASKIGNFEPPRHTIERCDHTVAHGTPVGSVLTDGVVELEYACPVCGRHYKIAGAPGI